MSQKKKPKIPVVPYKDWLVSQKKTPERTSPKYVDFWLKHINYCKSGVMCGGIYFSGWLYWHLNFFKVPLDIENEHGDIDRVTQTPPLRDNEWYLNWGMEQSKEQQKPLIIFGSRRIAKSVYLASKTSYQLFIKYNSTTVIIGGSSNDLQNITDYIDQFYEKRPDCFSDLMKFGQWARSQNTVDIAFSKKEVTKKDPITGEKRQINPITKHLMEIKADGRYLFSKCAVRNLEHGQKVTKEELLAGLTPTEVIGDEIGKYDYTLPFSALKPALMASNGRYRALPTLVGTGGSVELSSSAERDFLNVDKSGYTNCDVEEYKKLVKPQYFQFEQESDARTGLFPMGQMSNVGNPKEEIDFSDYVSKKLTKKEKDELKGLTIQVTQWEQAKKQAEAAIEEEKFKSDKEGKKAQMYYPFQPEDCFLYSGNNPFPVEDAKKHQREIKEKGQTGEHVALVRNADGSISIEHSDKPLVEEYPFKGGTHDAPVVLYERPIHEDPRLIKRGTYVAGFDGYKVDTTKSTDSVGVVYIFKCSVGITGFQWQIVASYASRPRQNSIFLNNVLSLLELYNAEVLPEHDTNLYNHMKVANKLNLFAKCNNLAQGINPNTKTQHNFGLYPTEKNKEHVLKLVQEYAEEMTHGGVDKDGNEILVKGITRIPDPMLLEEMIKFSSNYDRIIAFGHALAWAKELHSRGIIGSESEVKNDTADKWIATLKKNQRRSKYR